MVPTSMQARGMVLSIMPLRLHPLLLLNNSLTPNFMTVTLNNKLIELRKESTLHQLIEQEKIPTQNVAIAVNNKLVMRCMWCNTILQDGDNIVAIVAAYGG